MSAHTSRGLLFVFLVCIPLKENIFQQQQHFTKLSLNLSVLYQLKKISRTSCKASSSSSSPSAGICECSSFLLSSSPSFKSPSRSWTSDDLWPSGPWCCGLLVYGTVSSSVVSRSVSETHAISWTSLESVDSSFASFALVFEVEGLFLALTMVSSSSSSTYLGESATHILFYTPTYINFTNLSNYLSGSQQYCTYIFFRFPCINWLFENFYCVWQCFPTFTERY